MGIPRHTLNRILAVTLAGGGVLAAVACAGSAPQAASRTEPSGASDAATSAESEPPPRADGRLPGGVRPTSYAIELTVDPRKTAFLGHVRIALEIERPTRAIVLHGRELSVTLASLRRGSEKLWARARLRKAAGSKREPEELVVAFDRELAPGPAELDLEYEASFGSGLRGLYRVEDRGESYAYTQFEPTDARRAFPCFDEPSFKVPVELKVSVPQGYLAFSNTPIARTSEQLASQLVTYEFEKSQPTPSYLIALGVGPFEIIEGAKTPVPVRLIAPKGRASLAKLAVDLAPAHLALLAEYFQIPYPYKKLDLVAVPNFAAGAMENPGLVTFREELVLLDTERASASARRALARVMAHELAHQWFGNLVTMAWWDDLWLNEAFATWMGTKIVDRHDPAFGAGREFLARKAAVMSIDSLASARRIRQPVRSTSEALEAFDGITYTKGASVLGMVEGWLGEQTMQKGVRAYLEAHLWGNASAKDLFHALDQASGRDVSAVMDSFVDQTGVPVVSAEACAGAAPGALRVGIAQSPYRLLGSAETAKKTWRFPVCAKGDGKAGASCALLDAERGELSLGGARCPAHFWPNDGSNGYYRVRLPAATLLALARSGSRSMPEAERIGLIGDAWALVRSGELEVDIYLEIVAALSRDATRVIWDQIAESLRMIDRALVSDASRPEFARRMGELLRPSAQRAGFEPTRKDGPETAILRRTLLPLLADLGEDPWAKEQARARAQRWLADPASVDADVAALSLDLHSRRGDEKLFATLVEKLKSAATPEQRLIALGGLVGFDDPKLVERMLRLTLDGTIRSQDLRYVFGPLFERRATRDVSYRFILEHFAELEKKIPSFIVGRTVWVMASLCDEARVGEAERFFRPRVASIEGAEKHLSQAVEAGRLCAALAARQSPGLERWIGKKGPALGPARTPKPLDARR
jgi:cytosol alanyl aminopeptidase